MLKIFAYGLLMLMLPAGAAEAKPLRIGVSTPLSGPGAIYGEDIRNALEFVATKHGPGRVELIIEDDRCNGKEGVSVAHKFVQVHKVQAVTGFACSGALLSAAPIYERAGVVAMGISTSAPTLSKAGSHIFRTCPSDTQAVAVMFGVLKAKDGKIGAVFEETDFAQDYRRTLESANSAGELNLRMLNFRPDEADYRTGLARFAAEKIAGLLIVSQTENSLLQIVRQARQLKLEVPLFGHVFPGSPAFLKEAGLLSEGFVYTDFSPPEDSLNELGRKWFDEYVREYGRPLSGDWYFTLSYAALNALIESLGSGADPANYLRSHEFQGVLRTPYRFRPSGDIEGVGFILSTIKNGRPAPYPAP